MKLALTVSKGHIEMECCITLRNFPSLLHRASLHQLASGKPRVCLCLLRVRSMDVFAALFWPVRFWCKTLLCQAGRVFPCLLGAGVHGNVGVILPRLSLAWHRRRVSLGGRAHQAMSISLRPRLLIAFCITQAQKAPMMDCSPLSAASTLPILRSSHAAAAAPRWRCT
jgi:hypothetical protein